MWQGKARQRCTARRLHRTAPAPALSAVRRGEAGQGRAGQGRAVQGRAGQGRAGGGAGQGRAGAAGALRAGPLLLLVARPRPGLPLACLAAALWPLAEEAPAPAPLAGAPCPPACAVATPEDFAGYSLAGSYPLHKTTQARFARFARFAAARFAALPPSRYSAPHSSSCLCRFAATPPSFLTPPLLVFAHCLCPINTLPHPSIFARQHAPTPPAAASACLPFAAPAASTAPQPGSQRLRPLPLSLAAQAGRHPGDGTQSRSLTIGSRP